MSANRNLRVGISLLLLAGVASTLFPYATSYVSTSAVVNAPLITIRAPFDGRLVDPLPRIATPVAQGEPLVALRSERQDLREGTDLRARAMEIDGSIAALRQEMAVLDDLDGSLASREAQFRVQVLAANMALQKQILARLQANRAHGVEISSRLRRSRTLAAGGAVPAATLADEEAELGVNRAEGRQLAALLEDARIERQGIEAGVVPRMSGTPNDYQRQRRDEIAMRRAALASEVARLEAEREGLVLRQAGVEEREAAHRLFEAVAPTAGVVWQVGVTSGAEVLTGSEVIRLLDCRQRFLVVTVPERHFESIRPGAAASVQLLGSDDVMTLKVSAVLGSGAKSDHPELAAEPKDVPPGQVQVLLRLAPPEDVAAAASAFCDVGRTAEVRFDRSLEGDLRPLRRLKTSLGQLIAGLWPGPAQAAPGE